MARLAWNLPLLHALDTEPDTDGARIRAHAERVLGRLHRWREVLAPLFAAGPVSSASSAGQSSKCEPFWSRGVPAHGDGR